MKQLSFISSFNSIFFLLLVAGPLHAQFSDGIVVTEAGLTGRGFHLSSKEIGFPLLREVDGDITAQINPGLNTSTTFIIEDGQDDGSGWTADARYFYIRSVTSGKYLTIFGTTNNSPVNLDSLYPAGDDAEFAQQFELTPAPAGSGWYKLRSRLSNIGPDLVLEVAPDGQIIAGTPQAGTAQEQKFAFNLALPDSDDRTFYILGINSAHFVCGSRFNLPNQFAQHKERFDYSALWKIQNAGEGYYFLFNPLTQRYLSANGSTSAGDTLYMSSEGNDFAKWELDKSGHTFRFRNKASDLLLGTKAQTQSGRPLFQTTAAAVGIKWIVSWYIDDDGAAAGDFDKMLDGSAPANPCVFYGEQFKRALAERAGLTADSKWFPLLFNVLLGYYGDEDQANRALQNFQLDNPGHRVELALALRNYLLRDVAKRSVGTWTQLELEAIQHFEARVQLVRSQSAQRLQNALNTFLASPAFINGTQQFSALVETLDADDFAWPDEYDPQTELQVEMLAQYAIAAKTFNAPNHDLPLTATAGISVLATPGLAPLINMAIASRFPYVSLNQLGQVTGSNYFKAFPKLAARIAGYLGRESSVALGAAVANAGTVISVITLAAEVLAAEIKEAVELQKLQDEVNTKIIERLLPVNFHQTLNAQDLLARIKIYEDMDFVIGAAVETGFQYNFNDNMNPTPFELSCQNVEVLLGANGTAGIAPENITGGFILPLCGDNIQYTLSKSNFNCDDLGTGAATLTASNNLLSEQCQFTVTVRDLVIPGIICPPALTVSCAPAVPAVNLAAVTASDNCGAPVKSHVGDATTNMTCANRFTVTRTYRATDASNNSSTCTQTITVFDNAAPNFTSVPANVTVQCNSIPAAGTATATDGCGGGAVSVVYNGQSVSNILCTDRYTITRQWTATDACGNTRTATQRITVQDTQAPLFTSVPANITVQCNNIPAPGTATATDNCDTNVEVNYNGETRTNGSCPDTYTLTRRWTAADNCGNTRTVTQRITVRDTEKPAFTTVPPPITLECTQPIPAPGTASATDNCDNQVSITYLGQNATYTNCPNNYTLTRTWRAADNCGNWTTAIQTITVQDTQAPQFTSAPPHITIECSDLVPPIGQPAATDTCGGYVHIGFLGNSSAAGDCPQEYVITRTWRATDECGNSATATQTITVQDTQAPLFNNAPADLTLACGANLPTVPVVTASDNCDNLTPVTYLGEQNNGPNCPYTVSRTWQVADDCGNVRTHTQTIAVQGQSLQEPSEDRQAAAAAPAPFVLRLAPNPASEQVWVRFVLEQATEATLSILDLGGRLMYEQPFAASAGENSVPVQVGELPGGLYLVQLRAGVQRGVEKLVVE